MKSHKLKLYTYNLIHLSVFLFLLLPTFHSFSSTHEALQNINLQAPWSSLEAHKERDLHELLNFVDVVSQNDSEIHNVLENVKIKMKIPSIIDLAPYIQFCQSENKNIKGQLENPTKIKVTINFTEKKESNAQQGSTPSQNFLLANYFEENLNTPQPTFNYITISPHRTYIKNIYIPFELFCIKPSISKIEAISILVHELTHLANVDSELELLNSIYDFKNYDEYFKKEITRKGGEAHAFRLQIKSYFLLKQLFPSTGDFEPPFLKAYHASGIYSDYSEDNFNHFLTLHSNSYRKTYYEKSVKYKFQYNADLYTKYFQSLLSSLMKHKENQAYTPEYRIQLERDYQSVLENNSKLQKLMDVQNI